MTDFPAQEDIFSSGALARHLGIGANRIHRAVEQGWLPHMRFGPKLLRFKLSAIPDDVLGRLRAGHDATAMLQGRQLVYFIQAAAGPIKIGTALNPEHRISELRVAHYEELTLLGYINGGRRLERALQRQFRHLHLRGEWFRDGPDLLAELARRGVLLPAVARS